MLLTPLAASGARQTEVEISTRFRDPSIRATVLVNHGTIGAGPKLMPARYLAEMIEETAPIANIRDTLLATHSKRAAALPQYGRAADARTAMSSTATA